MKPLVRTPLAFMVLTLLVGGSVSRTPVRAQPLEVVDANGTKIGHSDVIGAGDVAIPGIVFRGQLPRVAFNLDGRVFALLVTQTGFLSDNNALFASPDCSGAPFVEDISATVARPLLLPPVVVAPPGQTVYLPVSGSPSQEISVGSSISEEGICEPVPAVFQPFIVSAFPIQGLLDLSTQFVPPFRVQLVPPRGGP